MRGAPGEVGSRQSSPYRGSAPIHRRHAANRDTRLPTMFDTPQIALTPWHWSGDPARGLDRVVGPRLRAGGRQHADHVAGLSLAPHVSLHAATHDVTGDRDSREVAAGRGD